MRQICLHDAKITNKDGKTIGRYDGRIVSFVVPIDSRKSRDYKYFLPAVSAYTELTMGFIGDKVEVIFEGDRPQEFELPNTYKVFMVNLGSELRFEFKYDGEKDEVDGFVQKILNNYP